MKKRREEKRGYSIIISKCTVKWSIIRAVQAKPGFLKTWIEFQIRGKTWVPGTVFRENLGIRFILMISVLYGTRPSFVYPLLRTSYFVFPRRIMKTEETSERQETRDQPESKTQNPERRRYRNCYMLPTLLPIL